MASGHLRESEHGVSLLTSNMQEQSGDCMRIYCIQLQKLQVELS